MSTTKLITSALIIAVAAVSSTEAFQASTTNQQLQLQVQRGPAPLFEATGGWGIGASRDITPEEYGRGDRRAFEGYELTERGDFMRNVKDEASAMQRAEMDELMGVAKIAGINMKSPKMNKFEPDVFGDDEDDLDLKV